MPYREFRPNALLSPFVETYWVAYGMDNGKSAKILPDGCVDIIFTFDKIKGTFHADVIGTMTTFLQVTYSAPIQMFGIRFKPAGITAFTRIPIGEFTDKSIELELVETLFDKSFYGLSEKQTTEEIAIHINNFLIRKLPYLYHPDKRIIRAVDLIYFAKGQLSLAKAASEVCLCQRHFERKFVSAIGISPKTFAKIVRFKDALQYLRNNPHKDLLSVAVECGYYDHAHLIKDFKTLSGDTPDTIRS